MPLVLRVEAAKAHRYGFLMANLTSGGPSLPAVVDEKPERRSHDGDG